MALDGEYIPSTSEWARDQVALFEASNGLDGATFLDKPVVVLTTRGVKTGALRKNPVMRVEHNGRYAVVASQGGAPSHPGWYFNIRAEPRVVLQDAAVTRDYIAHEAVGDEREAWWARATEAWPDYDGYQSSTDRVIAVFVLEPVNG